VRGIGSESVIQSGLIYASTGPVITADPPLTRRASRLRRRAEPRGVSCCLPPIRQV